MGRLRTAVLISGRGSNLSALIDEFSSPDAPAEIVLVVSNIRDAPGIELARKAGLACEIIDHLDFTKREDFEEKLNLALLKNNVDFICLAGFMRILTGGFTKIWQDRLINIHPSLLPAYPGLHTHKRAIADGVKFSGCTVHFVREKMDVGPIIVQAAVPIGQEDTPDSLASKILSEEHKCLTYALAQIARGNVSVDGKKVRINKSEGPICGVINPSIARFKK
jgi:phosphoribosylglycinamide formyltransferase-1